jgi:hypothetical protein
MRDVRYDDVGDSFMRIVLTIILLMAAAACGFGFLASTEPGVAPIWRVAYGGGGILCVLIVILLWLSRTGDSRRDAAR